MKNTKKIIAMTIAFIMTGVMLAGCGNGVDHKDYMKDSDSVTASVDKDVEKDSDKKSETADKADTDKKDEAQSETDKKADKDSTAETANQSDNSSSADNSSNTGNSGNAGNSNSGSVNKPNTGSGNSNTGNNGNHNGSVNKPSGGNNSNSGNSGNNGNHNGGSHNNGNGNNGGDNNKPAPHEHNFNIVVSTNPGNCQTASSTVKKCSCGETHTEYGSNGSHNMVHHDAQGHEVTDYDEHYICNQCGMDFGDNDDAAIEHVAGTPCVNYSLKNVAVGSHWEETSPAYNQCSICGHKE